MTFVTMVGAIALLSTAQSAFAAIPPVGFLGAVYPAPIDFTSDNSLITASWQDLASTIDSYIASNQTVETIFSNAGLYTFSIGTFSVHDPTATSLQYHHTGPDVLNSTMGVTSVDGDSIYRVGSVSKLLTVYALLLQLGNEQWDTSVLEYLPELASYNETSSSSLNAINSVNWEQVTLGVLAGQISGILRSSYPYQTDYLYDLPRMNVSALEFGFPPLNSTDPEVLTPCASFAAQNNGSAECPDDLYIQSAASRPPVFAPWTAPAYSNDAFSLLGLVLENTTSKSFADVFAERLAQPLNLVSTSPLQPNNLSTAVIPGGEVSNYGLNFGPLNPAGSFYSTTNDVAKIGISILNSTLLDPVVTRQWLKPITHSAKTTFSVGRPWEIYRITNTTSRHIVDLYTKSGDVEGYSAYIILSPDHGTGFSILVAGTSPDVSLCTSILADTVTSIMIPALESQAMQEAEENLAGTYQAADGLNSSITLDIDPVSNGLLVTSWISNGTTLLGPESVGTELGYDEMHMYPTGLTTSGPNGTQQVAFRATFSNKALLDKPSDTYGPFVSNWAIDNAWVIVDGKEYGNLAIDEFVFDLDGAGKAVSLTPVALRATLSKVIENSVGR